MKNTTVGLIVKYALYCVVVGAIAIILSGIFNSTVITVNWVKLLIGGALLYAVEFTCSWALKSNHSKKDDK